MASSMSSRAEVGRSQLVDKPSPFPLHGTYQRLEMPRGMLRRSGQSAISPRYTASAANSTPVSTVMTARAATLQCKALEGNVSRQAVWFDNRAFADVGTNDRRANQDGAISDSPPKRPAGRPRRTAAEQYVISRCLEKTRRVSPVTPLDNVESFQKHLRLTSGEARLAWRTLNLDQNPAPAAGDLLHRLELEMSAMRPV
mmetsp:Transcript_67793/g.180532  ORF Transcript_67793/g.180532 Transcript_67793/m.180532 type:complete len:199 (+) Transcript_67793:64-660(+)